MPKPIQILHLEDDPLDAELVQDKLTTAGLPHQTTRVQTGDEFKSALQNTAFDIILADYNLPGYDGISALKFAETHCPDTPFIFVSGAIGEDAAIEGLTRGSTYYVLKHKLARLMPAVQRALNEAQDRRERKQAEKELQESRQQLRELATHLQSAREMERTAIAREIHDELGQMLTVLKINAIWLKTTWSKPVTKTSVRKSLDKLDNMVEWVESLITSVRRIASDLRPAVLDEFGLIAAMEWQVQEFTKRTGIPCSFQDDSPDLELSPDQSTALFRILQEALTNVVRHAQATNVMVLLQKNAGTLRLEIRDNGKGIKPSEITNARSLGLVGLRERALLLGGQASISGAIPKGTTVVVEIPIHDTEHSYSDKED